MQELGVAMLIDKSLARASHSALPDSPVIPDRPPGRARLRTAQALHRLAARLERGRPGSLFAFPWPEVRA